MVPWTHIVSFYCMNVNLDEGYIFSNSSNDFFFSQSFRALKKAAGSKKKKGFSLSPRLRLLNFV